MGTFKKHLKKEKESLVHNINELYKIFDTSIKYHKRTMNSWGKHLKLINKTLVKLADSLPSKHDDIQLKYLKANK